MRQNFESKIFVLAPFGKDAAHLTKVLTSENFLCFTVSSIDELIERIKTSGVGMVITTEEVLNSPDSHKFTQFLSEQPTWSAIPITAFYSENSYQHALYQKAEDLSVASLEVTFLQRPVTRTTLISSVKTALRDRARQYKIRDLLTQLHDEIQSKEQDKSAAIDANLAKSQFLANMSHEIRTPLGAILGFLELMKDPRSTSNETSEYISVIDRNSRHLLRLIDDILDLSKVEAGKLELESSAFSLGELLRDFAALMRFKAQEKGIIFDLELATSLPDTIISDQVRLRQVLTNAVGNAVKFTDRGRVQLVCSYKDKTLKFVVTDTGRGLTLEQKGKLFQPFSQADPSTTRKYGGTGLGLVLTKRICQQMQGDYRLVSSQPGTGSAFEATLKIETDPTSAMLAPSGLLEPKSEKILEVSAQPLSNMKILLVEDSPDNQALIKIMLQRLGSSIDIAANGREGISKALSGHYNAVLMDVQMPFMDGHEATRALRKKDYRVPIIALTAHAMNEERERASASGFSDFLTKPVNRENLIQTLLKYASH